MSWPSLNLDVDVIGDLDREAATSSVRLARILAEACFRPVLAGG